MAHLDRARRLVPLRWDPDEIVCDRENGRTLDRPGLSYALERIAEGRAHGLVVSDLKRLSRSPHDLLKFGRTLDHLCPLSERRTTGVRLTPPRPPRQSARPLARTATNAIAAPVFAARRPRWKLAGVVGVSAAARAAVVQRRVRDRPL
ncbi:MAG: recombinase family protein [Solirubrobacteraceae bacterium]